MNPISNLMNRLEAAISKSRSELDEKQQSYEAQRSRSQEILSRITSLQGDVQRWKQQIVKADQQYVGEKQKHAELHKILTEAWGSPRSSDAPNYREIARIEVALSDFPRAREHLVAQLAKAERAVEVFVEENPVE